MFHYLLFNYSFFKIYIFNRVSCFWSLDFGKNVKGSSVGSKFHTHCDFLETFSLLWGETERPGTDQLGKDWNRILAYKYLMDRCQKWIGPDSFWWHPVTGEGSKGTNRNTRSSLWTWKKNISSLRTTEHWNRLPWEAVNFSGDRTFCSGSFFSRGVK